MYTPVLNQILRDVLSREVPSATNVPQGFSTRPAFRDKSLRDGADTFGAVNQKDIV